MRLYITDWDLERLGTAPSTRYVMSYPRWRCEGCGNYRDRITLPCCTGYQFSGVTWIEIIDNKVVDSGVM